ncbi:hypothetical protein [Methylobacterium sp. D48H]
MIKLNEVFGITSSVPTYTYVDRQGLDGQFNHLLSSDRHIVIYGASKQGKTSLRRKQLPEADCLIVPCKPEFKLEDVYLEIRRQLGKRELIGAKSTTKKGGSIKTEAKGKVGIPYLVEGQTGANLEGSLENTGERTYTIIPDGNSLVALADSIKSARKRVVIEDFHYLSEDERQRLSFDLKSLWDYGVFLIVIGVWAEQNLMTVYNNDLSGRVEEIDVRWSDADLDLVISKGEETLNFIFDDDLRSSLILDANGNVGLIQRMAEKVCLNSSIRGRQDVPTVVGGDSEIDKYREQICAGQQTRYHGFVELVGKGFKDPERTKLKMYHHLVRVCFEATDQELLSGLDRQVILARIQKYEPDANMTVLSAALSRLNRLQAERKISPPVLAYNSIARNVALVDREFLFFRRHTKSKWIWEQDDYEDELNAMMNDSSAAEDKGAAPDVS